MNNLYKCSFAIQNIDSKYNILSIKELLGKYTLESDVNNVCRYINTIYPNFRILYQDIDKLSWKEIIHNNGEFLELKPFID